MAMQQQDGRREDDLPVCDWVYFATPAVGSGAEHLGEFVARAKLIVAHVYQDGDALIRMPLVQRLRPGDTILLVYGGHGRPYRAVAACTVAASAKPVQTPNHTFEVFHCIEDPLAGEVAALGYRPDPVVKRLTAISLAEVRDVSHLDCPIRKPEGNNTLRRWAEVFSARRPE